MNSSSNPLVKHRIADLVVLVVLAGCVALYCLDAARASTDILNLILVLPLSVIVFVLCSVQFILNVPRVRSAVEHEEPESAEPPLADVLPVASLFAAYILTLRWLGFDVGTCIFIAGFLWLQGERRWPWLLGYSFGFAFAIAEFFARMLPYAMPMLVLGAD